MYNHKFREAGGNITIYNPVTLITPEKMVLRNNILISEYAYIAGGLGLHIGNFVHIAAHSSISGGGVCILEDFVGVAAGARLITGSENVMGEGIPSPLLSGDLRSYYRSHVHCKRHSFISTNAVVLPGITIGEGSVVGAASVVTKDLEPWGIYLGSPAVRVKDRPRDRILELEKRAYAEYSVDPSDVSLFTALIRDMNGEQR